MPNDPKGAYGERTYATSSKVFTGTDQFSIRIDHQISDKGTLFARFSLNQVNGPLTEEEWKIMRLHPVYSYELLHPITYLRPALDIPYCHHEKWDGSGYPHGLKGEQIPLAARIFALVDVWDALRSDRPYRPAWSAEKAKEHIRSLSGVQFDPAVLDVFLKALDRPA
jgi:HD-GYP domain-containing protein (c-di-GMP phosphodiesterase class II)